MARGRKVKKDNVVEVGVLKLIKFDPTMIEEKRKQNFTLDEFVTTSVDINGNWENWFFSTPLFLDREGYNQKKVNHINKLMSI